MATKQQGVVRSRPLCTGRAIHIADCLFLIAGQKACSPVHLGVQVLVGQQAARQHTVGQLRQDGCITQCYVWAIQAAQQHNSTPYSSCGRAVHQLAKRVGRVATELQHALHQCEMYLPACKVLSGAACA